MTIKTGIGLNVQGISGDTPLVVPPSGERWTIEAITALNTTASTDITIDFYVSPNLTTASGKQIASYSLSGGASLDIDEAMFLGLANGENLVAVDTGGAGVNCTITVNKYSGTDV